MRQIEDKLVPFTGQSSDGYRSGPIHQRFVVVEWSDVEQRVIDSLRHGKDWSSQPSMNFTLQNMHQNLYTKNTFNGGGFTPARVLEWLDSGFRAKEFANSAERVPAALQHRAVWSEEDGDVDVGRLVGGHDEFFLGMADRPEKPGVKVQIEMAFACGVKSKVIAEYGAWVAGLLGAMEEYGFDMVVDIWIPLDGLYQGDRGVRSNVLIRVKKANEVSDFTDWSVMFSPAGYRTVGFSAKCVAGDKIGKTATSGLGKTLGGKTWDLNYDKEESIVRITVNQRAGGYEEFPAERLTQKAIEAGLIPDPNAYDRN